VRLATNDQTSSSTAMRTPATGTPPRGLALNSTTAPPTSTVSSTTRSATMSGGTVGSPAVLTGTLIGLLQGLIITKAGVPSFVVTLAGLLAWNGVVLILIGGRGTVVISDRVVIGIANRYLPPVAGWVLAAVLVAGFVATQLARQRARRTAGLPTVPPLIVALRVVLLTVLVGGAVVLFNASPRGGVPVAGVLMAVLLLVWSFVASRTRFGRHVYAVGGNAEAARRAGIDVDRVRVAVFMIASTMAALGGVVLASRLRSVDTAAGGGDILLNSIAAAVIGGTSLFGGRGKVSSALLGALVIASVANGMGLLGLSSGAKFVVTGLVLLASLLVDSFARRGRSSRGLA
jgi:D-xylose transport system permease protein